MTPNPPEPKSRFFQRKYAWIGFLVLGIAVVGVLVFFPWKVAEQHKVPTLTMVNIPPPPPPPPQIPPPPIPPPPEQQKPVEQPQVSTDLNMPKDSPAKATTSDAAELSGTENGDGGGGGGSRWGWYAASVQAAIREALHRNEKTRNSSLGIRVRIWPDRSGKVVRVELTESTGDVAVDSAIKDEVLRDLQLNAPPPDMPSPIILLLARH